MASVFSVRAGEPLFQSGNNRTALVELYTSEGCSSCPPAEAWFSTLAVHPGLWKQFVPVAFHVDYWDDLGWKDQLASPLFTQRQRDYAAAWGNSSVYTPGFVVNGVEQHGAPSLDAGTGEKPGIVTVSRDGDKLNVTFSPSKPGGYTAHVALLGSGVVSNVARGENAGRKLSHDFVAIAYSANALENAGDLCHGHFDFPAASIKAPRLALAVWITTTDGISPIQATGGWLK